MKFVVAAVVVGVFLSVRFLFSVWDIYVFAEFLAKIQRVVSQWKKLELYGSSFVCYWLLVLCAVLFVVVFFLSLHFCCTTSNNKNSLSVMCVQWFFINCLLIHLNFSSLFRHIISCFRHFSARWISCPNSFILSNGW